MKRLPPWLLPVLLTLALGAGLLTLMQQRLDEGSTYAQYSSFRADPFGTKGLFLALGELPGRPLQVERIFRPLQRVAKGLDGKEHDLTGTTVLLLGESPYRWGAFPPGERMKAVENIARQGGRVVLAFEPIKNPLVEYDFGSAEKKDASPTPSPSPELKREDDPSRRGQPEKPEEEKAPTKEERRGIFGKVAPWRDRLGSEWGISLVRVKRKPALFNPKASVGADNDYKQEDTFAASPAFPDTAAGAGTEALPWLTALDFEIKPSETPLWRVIYWRGRKPAVVEREFGKGTLVLCSDSFFLSNESLFREHHPAAIHWLLGEGAKRVIFDEHFLGTREDPGIMSLSNRFGLSGAVVGFVVLALLYVWRNASPLVPPPPDPGYEGAPPQAGLGAEAGFPSLLRRAVAGNDLARFVFEQWKSSPSGQELRASPTPERVAALEKVLVEENQAKKKDPARAYRAMREKLGVRKKAGS